MAIASLISSVKFYRLPLLLFSTSLVFQLMVIPSSSPLSHYDVLGLKDHSSTDDVRIAYEKLLSNWSSVLDVQSTENFIQIQYAFELLTNPLWKRDYDLFGISEQLSVISEAKEKYHGKHYLEVKIPLLKLNVSGDIVYQHFDVKDFDDNKALLIQIYSLGSSRCAEFSDEWKGIVAVLGDVANTGTVELGDTQFVLNLTGKGSEGQHFFQNDLPSFVAFPLGCRSLGCLMRYNGDLSFDALIEWFTSFVLGLPQIPYYKKESLAHKFIPSVSPHKVKVIFFSRTGERATPIVRHSLMRFHMHASFAFVLWEEDDSLFWSKMLNVESAPAIVILKDPGIKPVVYHGSINSSSFIHILEQNKHQELRQLRSETSMELGCDARGYARAGVGTSVWYCVILAGRLGLELDKMRQTICSIQEMLLAPQNQNRAEAGMKPSEIALAERRLTFTWLEGESQKKYCLFYVDSPTGFEACGPRVYPIDKPQLLMVRYKRNSSENVESEKFGEDRDDASQLVARYKGLPEARQIIEWISDTIENGDTQDLPFFRIKTPELAGEEAGADMSWSGKRAIGDAWLRRSAKIASKIRGRVMMGEPKWVGEALLLASLLSFAVIWVHRGHTRHAEVAKKKNGGTTSDAGKARQEEEWVSKSHSD